MVQEGECQLDIPNLGEMGEHLRGEAQWWLTATGTTSSAGNCYIPPSYAHTCPQVCYIIGENAGEVLLLCTFQ
jgi:hypothetical protein